MNAMQPAEFQPITAPTAVKIVEAAGHLFLQRGYKAVSINDIIKAAEVTKPTLYYYFSDKEELFVQMGLRVLAEMSSQLQAALQLPAALPQRLAAVATVLMDDRDSNMRMMRHEMMTHLSAAQRTRLAQAFFVHIFRPIVELMEQALAEGLVGRYPAPALAKMFMGLTESFHEFAHPPVQHGEVQHEALFGPSDLGHDALVDLFLHGVGSRG
ncbi:MAG: TetR/AcrR family transcriptional regulator [Candidatus Viridilinea halotolerans]|uniref:TetR/AcrR family transcriptional regulator n=1 Tax=Candidatus Viridilinea halotolerans TaxID=2491704 RepID=A0A426TUT0_9CHLR|nr:MAG: TetR/AcrR family transcriptional regulator [Candidatus Viridilinea halotolerans]